MFHDKLKKDDLKFEFKETFTTDYFVLFYNFNKHNISIQNVEKKLLQQRVVRHKVTTTFR